MKLSKEQLDNIISTSIALGYSGRQQAVITSPTEEGREEFIRVVTAAAIETFHCKTTEDGIFCSGCEKCLPSTVNSPDLLAN